LKKKSLKDKLYHSSEIVLKLDEYNDIFSDFDARPFHQKALSQDFLSETKRASADKRFDVIDLKLLVPRHKSSAKHEDTIKKRLKTHFKHHFILLHQEKRKIIKQGIVFTIIGLILMVVGTLISIHQEEGFLSAFLIVLFEPAGWFLFWEGLDLVIFESKRKNPDFEFYEKMSNSRVYFYRY
jgi:hypothetical protein